MAKGDTKGQSMAEQADAIIGMVEEGTDEELKQVHAGGQKDSKWRRVIQAFVDSGARIWKIPEPEDGKYKLNAITSGLNARIDAAKDAGAPLPVRVTMSKAKGYVLLVNTELVDEADVEAAEAAS